jgi:hypothetical protein
MSGSMLRDAVLRLMMGDDVAMASAEICTVADFELGGAARRPFVDLINWIDGYELDPSIARSIN